jgi:hypothetical protein
LHELRSLSDMRKLLPACAVLVAVVLLLTGCQSGPRPVSGQVVSPPLGFKVSLPDGGKGWEMEIPQQKNAVLFTVKGVSGAIAVHVTNVAKKEGLVTVAASELLVNFADKKMIDSNPKVVAGQQAICQNWDAKLGKQDVRVRSCVLLRGQRIYDIAAWAPPEIFSPMAAKFEEFLAGFSVE